MKRHLLSPGILSALLTGHPAVAAGSGHWHSNDSAIGVAGKAGKATRTVKVDMTDAMRFVPATVRVAQGETVRFVVTNSGKLKHEFVLGTEEELKEHYEQMKKFPEMEHADPNMVTVAPGQAGEVVWQFTKAGRSTSAACSQGTTTPA